jgi:hypothetical protein
MEPLDLGKFEAQIGLMIREKDNPDNYALLRFEDLEEIIKFYNSFKKEFKKCADPTHQKKNCC